MRQHEDQPERGPGPDLGDYLGQPNWEWAPEQNIGPYPCGPQQIIVEVDRPQGTVPHHLPGSNAFVKEFAEKYHLPFEATRGGAETTYPEYQLKLKEWLAKTPAKGQ